MRLLSGCPSCGKVSLGPDCPTCRQVKRSMSRTLTWGGAAPVIIPQTLRAVSARVGAFTAGPLPDAVLTVNTAATAAQLKDGSDATFDLLAGSGDGATACSGSFAVDWTIDPVSGFGTIPTVRVTLRTRSATADPSGTSSTQPRIGGVLRGSQHVSSGSATTFTDDFTTDPMSGQPWTTFSINGYKWGWLHIITGVDITGATNTANRVLDFKVDLLAS